MKLELEHITVSDCDRAEEFYTRLGWCPDDDTVLGSDFRILQLTSRFRVFDFIRQGSHGGRAWLAPSGMGAPISRPRRLIP